MTVTLAPFENLAAHAVLSNLDHADLIEACLTRGQIADHLDIFSDWRAMQAHALLSLVLRDERKGGKPFAVLAVGNTGQAGVAQAALLARPHSQNRRALATAGLMIRTGVAEWCDGLGIHRIEARCWRAHPTAAQFLTLCGFSHETEMRGFGSDGRAVFSQFAWTAQQQKEPDTCA